VSIPTVSPEDPMPEIALPTMKVFESFARAQINEPTSKMKTPPRKSFYTFHVSTNTLVSMSAMESGILAFEV